MGKRTVEISAGFLEMLAVEGAEFHIQCVSGIPEGARVTKARVVEDQRGLTIQCTFEHPDLPSNERDTTHFFWKEI